MTKTALAQCEEQLREPVRILYLEDDPRIAEIVVFALEHYGGYVVRHCESGDAALLAAPHFQPDVCLFDVMLPGIDGPTTYSKLRELDLFSETPVIFMTAKTQTHEVAKYRELGALGVINKPFDPLAIGSQISGFLN